MRCCARCSRRQTASRASRSWTRPRWRWELAVTEVAEQELAGAIAAVAGQPFDLAAEVPLRVRLFGAGRG